MAEVTYKGKTFEVDEDGFLLKFDEWCPEWLEYVKESEGITDLKEVYELFPSGPGKGACKMAGLPKPTGCV